MDDLHLFFEIMGVNLNMAIFACKHDNSTNISHWVQTYTMDVSRVSWLSLKMNDLDLFFEIMGVDFNMKISNFRL